MERVKWGRVKIKDKRIYTLAYVDDLILAEDENEMTSMIGRLEEYLETKKL